MSVNVPEFKRASHLLVEDKSIIEASVVPVLLANVSALNLDADVVVGANQIGV